MGAKPMKTEPDLAASVGAKALSTVDALGSTVGSPASSSAKALATTLAGAGTLSFGGYTANDVAMIIGAVVAVVGLIVQWVYRHKEYRLKEREANARMAERGFYE